MSDELYIMDRREWLAAMRRRQPRRNQPLPNAEPLYVFQRANGGFKILNGEQDSLTARSENRRRSRLVVSVAFDETSLQQPIKQCFEVIKVISRLISVVIHGLWFFRNLKAVKPKTQEVHG